MEEEDFNEGGGPGGGVQRVVSAIKDYVAGVVTAYNSDVTGASSNTAYGGQNSGAYKAGMTSGHVAAFAQAVEEMAIGT